MKKLLVVLMAALLAPAGMVFAGKCKPKHEKKCKPCKPKKKHDHDKKCPPKNGCETL